MKDGYRDSAHAIPGFNMLVLDVDHGVSIKMVQKLISDNEYIIYTTKRHTEENNRFRIVLPMSKIIKLTPEDHKMFYKNVYDTLPFEVDEAPNDIARKWQTYKTSKVFTNKGELFDPTRFIPNTAKNTARETRLQSFSSDMSKLERYIFSNTEGRSNSLIKLALAYVDRGDDADTIVALISAANGKLQDPLPEAELAQTVYKTIYKRVSERTKE
jgi:predicted choloylglycine hydrolase